MMKKATALTLVLVTMIVVGLGTTAILQMMISYANMKIITIEKTKAQYLAEAGMQYALWQCRMGNFGSPVVLDTEEWPIKIIKELQPDGSYKVIVTVQYPGI